MNFILMYNISINGFLWWYNNTSFPINSRYDFVNIFLYFCKYNKIIIHILIFIFKINNYKYSDKTQNVWIWNFNETDKLYIDKNEEIRFQVLTELFVDTGPMSKKKPFGQDPQESTKQLNESAESELVVPYSIIVIIFYFNLFYFYFILKM